MFLGSATYAMYVAANIKEERILLFVAAVHGLQQSTFPRFLIHHRFAEDLIEENHRDRIDLIRNAFFL